MHVFIALLVLLLACAVLFDVRRRRIPNWLTLGGLIVGIVLSLVLGDIKSSLLALAIATPIFWVFWDAKMIGGGDHKLIMAVSVFIGYPAVIPLLLATGIFGGVLSLVAVFIRAERPWRWKKIRLLFKTTSIPYSVAIALGAVTALLL
jgi:prepilin peptidase CpaA